MARIPVRCEGNQNKKYDGKTWLERAQDIVEVNNVPVSGGAPPLKEGDAVKVRQIVKGGREKIWSGVIFLHPHLLEGIRLSPMHRVLLGSENRMQRSKHQRRELESLVSFIICKG